ncbi:CD109 antigen [Oryzias latipes]|uniref:CD109 antigen n=1 Tax=Oryzias latipes TaxID=8090 RepID=UPI0005CC110F|nr:CD109 antigen [Oryzias latipes]
MDLFKVWGVFCFIAFSTAQDPTNRPDPPPSYLLLAPRTIQARVPTCLSVSILGRELVTVLAQIFHGKQLVATNSTTVKGGSTRMLTLPVIDGEADNKYPYVLEVKGYVGKSLLFSNSTNLSFDPKGCTTFIQTDKLNYLPGQVVKIRAVSILYNGKPANSSVNITITDPRGNFIRQWQNKESNLGVVSTEFELSENPPLGQWTILTEVKGAQSQKNFFVAHYVLPRFDVSIKAPDILYRGDTLNGCVTAKYSYGKPVQGQLNLTFIHHFPFAQEVYSESREINGMENFTFGFSYYHPTSSQMFSTEKMEYLMIEVQVTEDLTGLTYSDTMKVSLIEQKYKIVFEDFPKTLKPSQNFTATLRLLTYNDQPLSLEDQMKMVEVSVVQMMETWWNMGMETMEANSTDPLYMLQEEVPPKDMQFPVPADGVIPLHIEVMKGIEMLIIDVSFDDCHKTLQLRRGYVSPSNSFLQIQKPSEPAQVGTPLWLTIKSNFDMGDIHYLIKSRGQIVSAGTTSANLTLIPEGSWAPSACIIVYGVQPDGEVINDGIHLPIAKVLQNKVSLSWSSSPRKPAEDVTLKVSVAEPGSLVGLLVVDRATQGANTDNDIHEETVLQEMLKFDGSMNHAMPSITRIGDPLSVFNTCDLEVMTDASLHNAIWQFYETYGTEGNEGNEGPMQQNQEPHERKYFPETWIWMDVNTGDSHTVKLPLTVPDSITSWTATAFVMSEHLGLGITEEPATLTVFQDFFLSLNLPPYVIRGEDLVLEIILFNYLQQDQEVTVIVAESETFEFIFPDIIDLSMPSVRQVHVASGGGTNVLVPIRPLVLGEIPISVKATSFESSDFISTTVLVKAEGLEQTFSSSVLLELSAGQMNLSKIVAFTFPPDVVVGSERASVTAIGDILGPSISGLDSLIQMPYGCGEQNMIHLAPNIFILQYLTLTGQDDPEITKRATDYMMRGYEQELSFQRADGSFSAFGDSDASGSTWLSAFVLKCFLQAQKFIVIDSNVLLRVASWISAQQGADGRFEEPGRVIHTELQGGLDGSVSLTAYVLIALLEADAIRTRYANEVSSALMYLETRVAMGGVPSNYSLSLVTYALALAGSSTSENTLADLIEKTTIKDGWPMWSSPNASLSPSWQPTSADIETMSYLLLSLHKLNHIPDGLELMKALSQQRNSMGGYGSTQDTIVALQALSTFAAAVGSYPSDLNIKVTSINSGRGTTFHINQENYLVHQMQQIEPEQELNLEVTAEGHGLALLQLNVFYNIKNEKLMRQRRDADSHEAFTMYIELSDINVDLAQLSICSSLSAGVGLNATGMAIMEVGLLSGFLLQEPGVSLNDVVKKVEVQPGKVIVYLDSVTTEEMCLLIPLMVEYKVAKVQEVAVILYDYYEPRRRTERMYTSDWRNTMSTCSFCGDDCSQCQANDNDITVLSHGSRLLSLICFPLIPVLLFILVIM